jgi:hypothetical protein
MIYSDFYVHKENKLPTVVGFLFVLFITIFFLRLFLGSVGSSKATLKVAKRVEIVNLSPTQVSIFWQTDKQESGWVIYGEMNNLENKIVFDENDINNLGQKKSKYIFHLATLKELTPGKKYFFKIVTDNNQIIVQPDGKSFSFTTPYGGSNIQQNISPAFGKILQSNSVSPLTNSYIILNIKDCYPLLTKIKSEGDGSWLIPLNQLYRKDNQNVQTISDKDKILIEVLTNNGDGLTITTNKSKISPLPQTIVFIKDKNYSFLEEDNVLSAMTDLGSMNINQTEITYPKEGSLIPGSIPLIKGTAKPFARIEITVNSKKTYSAITSSDSKGNWSYLLPENLELGPHIIIIKTKDVSGKEITITRRFTIIAQQGNEGRVLGTATGSATITPTDIITYTPTPTTVITSVPSAVPTELKRAGSNFTGTIFGSLSLIIIGGGILLAF